MPKIPKKLYILHGVHVRWMPIFNLLNKGVPLCHNIILLAGASGMTAELSWKAAHGGMWVSPWRGACANYVYDRPSGYRWTELELMRAARDSIEKHNASLYAKLNMTDPNPPLTLEDLIKQAEDLTKQSEDLTKQSADIQSKIDKFKDK